MSQRRMASIAGGDRGPGRAFGPKLLATPVSDEVEPRDDAVTRAARAMPTGSPADLP
ncbi:hypothetical protein [Solicola sp. PLA-1-18]|uniref:hypothetical protein n=1 Tax=Solicola sp. PLA-1-18 TaxID=3380532 RepID=UPI003B7F13EF